jgi:hypothetical protein
MNLSFIATSASLQFSSDQGSILTFGLKMKPGPDPFPLRRGLSLRDANFTCTVHPESQNPFTDKCADGPVGELSPLMSSPSVDDHVYMVWVQIPDRQFDSLMFQATRQNLPTDVTLGIEEKNDVMSGGVYNDEAALMFMDKGVFPVQRFVFTMELVRDASSKK